MSVWQTIFLNANEPFSIDIPFCVGFFFLTCFLTCLSFSSLFCRAQKENETKQKNSPQENSSGKKDTKSQDKEAEGQCSAKVKGPREFGRQSSAPDKSQEESKQQRNAKIKGQEKLKNQSGVQSKNAEEAGGHGKGQTRGQGHSKQGSESKVDGNGSHSMEKADAVHHNQLSTEGKLVS